MSILQVFLPVSLILRPIDMRVNSIAVRLVVPPLAVKHVSINVPEFALAVRFISLPLTLVTSTIRPDLFTLTMPFLPFPLASIDCAILKAELFTVLYRRTCILYTLDCFMPKDYLVLSSRLALLLEVKSALHVWRLSISALVALLSTCSVINLELYFLFFFVAVAR